MGLHKLTMKLKTSTSVVYYTINGIWNTESTDINLITLLFKIFESVSIYLWGINSLLWGVKIK
jgi:hypothetical protein